MFVDNGPVFENIVKQDDIDIEKFPTPVWHRDDGGRYIGTGCYSVTMDPDEKWINAGCYRAMIQDKKSVSLLMVPGKHGYMHRQKYFRKGERMPIALVLGGDPLFFFMAGTEHPYGVCEYDVVGGMRRKPVEVVRGKITGLPFPANSEIVFEGFLNNDNRKFEGPFGEWTGYYASDESAQPVLEIEAIYHRNDPIILGVPPIGGGSDEMARYRAIMRSAMLKNELRNAGVPDVTQVWPHEIGASRMLVALAIKQRYPGHAKQVATLASSCGSSVYGLKMVIVVDDDIDVSNLDQLMWATLVALRSGNFRRDRQAHAQHARRSALDAGPEKDPRLYQFAHDHRRHPPLRVGRQVPQGERAGPGSGAQGERDVRLPAEVKIRMNWPQRSHQKIRIRNVGRKERKRRKKLR